MANTYEDLLGGPPTQHPSPQPYQSYEDLVAAQAGPSYTPYTDEDKARDAAGMKNLGGAALVGGAAAAGGMALAPYGALAALGGEAGGTFLGELLRQKSFGEDTNLRDATDSALISLGLGTIAKTATKAYGALADIPPEYTRYIGRQNPARGLWLTMKGPADRAELELGRRIGRTVKDISSRVTDPRQEFVQLLKNSASTGTKVRLDPVIRALQDSMIPNATLPETINANRMIADRIDALGKRNATGGLFADELDSLINKELDPSAFKLSGEVSTSKVGPAYASARDAAKEALLNNLPPEARVLRDQIADELTWRENAAKYFGLRKYGKTVVKNIAGINKPGNEEVKETLKFISEQSGIDFERMAMDLATKRAYTLDDRVKMGVVNRIMLGMATMGAATGRPGAGAAVLAVSPVAAHTISKVIAPLQNVAGPAGISLYEYLRKEYAMRTAPEAVNHPPDSGIMRITRVKNKEAVARAFVKATQSGAGGSF